LEGAENSGVHVQGKDGIYNLVRGLFEHEAFQVVRGIDFFFLGLDLQFTTFSGELENFVFIIIYTKFKSLIGSDPVIQTLLPLTPKGEICDVNGVCIDADEDEVFKLTTSEGDLKVETEKDVIDTSNANFEGFMFEQPPNEIVDAILPLYMDSTILRSLQESLASELAARMNAMSAACDNADDLKTKLNLVYNRGRQAKITNEILEIVAGANAVG